MRCTHPETYVVKTTCWNGSEWKSHYHCGKCGKILKKERVQMANKHIKTQYVVKEEGGTSELKVTST